MIWFIHALLSAICAGGVAVVTKMNCKPANIYMVTALRMLAMGLTIFAVTLLIRKYNGFTLSSLDMRHWISIAATGVLGGLGALFYFMALDCGNVAHVVAIERLGIIFVIVFAYLFLGESVSVLKALGGLLMVSGGYLIVYY